MMTPAYWRITCCTADRIVSRTLYTDPQLGKVGLGEEEASQKGLDFRVARMPMSHVARAMEMDETRGMMKAVVEAGTGRILGGAVLGVEGGELMSMLQIAMMGELPYTALRDAPLAHPNPGGVLQQPLYPDRVDFEETSSLNTRRMARAPVTGVGAPFCN
jgi:pyruvate/2-oxoglutarate dehydrogenase complex dihydrolipoamide dehydrogenase (E3) component